MIRSSKRQTRKFCWTQPHIFEDKETINPHRNSSREKNFPINPMKTLLIASLCSVTLALNSFGQDPPPPPPPPVNGASQSGRARIQPAAATAPARDDESRRSGVSPGPGMTPLTGAPSSPVDDHGERSPRPPARVPQPRAVPETAVDKNFFVDNFQKGRPDHVADPDCFHHRAGRGDGAHLLVARPLDAPRSQADREGLHRDRESAMWPKLPASRAIRATRFCA